jgi:hypothetical protein
MLTVTVNYTIRNYISNFILSFPVFIDDVGAKSSMRTIGL